MMNLKAQSSPTPCPKRGDLEAFHTYLLPEIEKLLSKEEIILDAGCGYGAIANSLIDKGFNVYGVDASESRVAIANQKHPGRFSILDLGTDSYLKALNTTKFDTIISTEVIEHLFAPRKFITLCKQLLTQEGKLILSTPYHGYLKYLAIAVSGRMDNHLGPLCDGGHIKFWSRKTLTSLLNEQGFEVTQFIGCGRFPYMWKSMILVAKQYNRK